MRAPKYRGFNAKKPRSAYVKLIQDSADATRDLLLLRADAELLYAQGKLQKVLIDDHGTAAFCAPRSWRQICHGQWPTLHPDVLACATKAENRRAVLADLPDSHFAHSGDVVGRMSFRKNTK